MKKVKEEKMIVKVNEQLKKNRKERKKDKVDWQVRRHRPQFLEFFQIGWADKEETKDSEGKTDGDIEEAEGDSEGQVRMLDGRCCVMKVEESLFEWRGGIGC